MNKGFRLLILALLIASERRRLQGVAADIRAAMADVGRSNAESARYAEIAAMWSYSHGR